MATGGALAGVRVLDLTDASGRAAGKLLAEAGADVLRLRRGDPGPPLNVRGGVLDWWLDGGTRFLPLDLDRPDGRDTFRALAARADILIETEPPGRLAARGLDFPDLTQDNPRLVHISLTPFGREGPRAGWQAGDLVQAALGGVLSVTGGPEAPVNGWGRQTAMTGSFYAAICALAALRSGRGVHLDLSLHEAVIANTEQVLMYWFFQNQLPRAIAQRQRALHWSSAYDVMACRDGHIMITPASALGEQIDWLAEHGIDGFEDLRTMAPGPTYAARMLAFMDAIRAWARDKAAAALFLEGQRRGLPYGLVQGVAEAAASPQLEARGVFRAVAWDGPEVRIPGPLVRLPETPAPPPAPPPAAPEPPATALAAWPVRAAAPTGTGAPPDRPLAGVRVLDFTWVLAGPWATRTLAELGADIIRIQTEVRSQGANGNDHPYFMMWGRGKRSIRLNMKHPRALEVMRGLVERSDIVIDNFSAGVLERWGLGAEQLRAWNPRIITAGLSGCGRTGPWRDFVTYAPTIHALCGLTALTGPAGERDCGYGFSYNDHASGLAGALALLEALHARERTGRGQDIDLSQLEVGVFLTGAAYVEYLNTGREPVAAGNRDPFSDPAPHEVYRCADGRWLAVAARDNAEWARLAAAVGEPGLSAPELATVDGRRAARARIDARLAEWAAAREAEGAMRQLQAAGVAAGTVQNAQDLSERDAQLAARGWLASAAHPTHGDIAMDRFPVRIAGRPLPLPAAPPAFGEHSFAVYGELLGWSDEQIAGGIGDGLFI